MTETVPDAVDPFDLPEWLGTETVLWEAEGALWSGCLIRGSLRPRAAEGVGGAETVACDLFAVDEAYPAPVADEEVRRLVHQAWCHGQVLLARPEGRLRLLTPGRSYDPPTVLEAVGRLARAVGARPESYAVLLHPR